METRARKLRRIGQQQSIPRTDTNQNLFLDVVPQDVLSHFVRHLSKRPFSDDWINSVNDDDVLTILRIGGAFSTVSQKMFKSLDFHYVCNDIGKQKFDLLASMLAPHLESLFLDVDRIRVLDSCKFSSLRVLRVNMENVSAKMFKRVLTLCGSSLVELIYEWGSMRKSDARNIARLCKSLKVLDTVGADGVNSLKVIWEELGSVLKKFSGCIPLDDLPLIALHCSVLEELAIGNIEYLKNENSQVVMESLQALQSLQVLDLSFLDSDNYSSHMASDEIETLVLGRPSNFLFDIGWVFHTSEKFSDIMHKIGSRLRMASLYFVFDSISLEASFSFNNVLELSLAHLGDHPNLGLERLFVQPMPNLRSLCIRVKCTTILRHIARSVSSLRKLHCDLSPADYHPESGPRVHDSDVTQLLRANRRLHRLEMKFGRIRTYPSNDIICFISCLHISESMMHVVIRYTHLRRRLGYESGIDDEKYEKLRDACACLRTRRISVESFPAQ